MIYNLLRLLYMSRKELIILYADDAKYILAVLSLSIQPIRENENEQKLRMCIYTPDVNNSERIRTSR
jgi:hypothetical protein